MLKLWKLLFKILVTVLVLQVFITKLLIFKICQRIPGSSMFDPKLITKLTPEGQLAVQAFETYVVPAVKDINKQCKVQDEHFRNQQRGILEVIKEVTKVDAQRGAQLLETLQRQDYEGVNKILNSVFSGYVALIDSLGNQAYRIACLERAKSENIKVSLDATYES